MFLHELHIQNFRCFVEKSVHFSKKITIITGDNGAGKTSILEAIHYLGYFKSFRTHLMQDLLCNQAPSFFLRTMFTKDYDFETLQHQLQIGYGSRKKSIKVDQKSISSYKQILPLFQVVTLTEDDIDLIQGSPAVRRAFIDQAVLFGNPSMFDEYNKFRQIVDNRNALLASGRQVDQTELEVWNFALWQQSVTIQQVRIAELAKVQQQVNLLLEQHFEGIYEVALQYDAKVMQIDENYQDFTEKLQRLIPQEMVMKRSLFGAHLDDLMVKIRGKKARVYASRGQQKLISLLCKVAWATRPEHSAVCPILLIDDFIADFDETRLTQLVIFFIKCRNQIILTAPFYDENLRSLLEKADPEIISV